MIEAKELDTLDKEFIGHYGQGLHAVAQPHIEREWNFSILPALRASTHRSGVTAKQYENAWCGAWYVTHQLFHALHSNAHIVPKERNPHLSFWCHQPIEFFRNQYLMRGISIDKDALLRTAAFYLGHPESRTNWLDWIFLDALVLTEVIATSDYAIETLGGIPAFLASQFAHSDMAKYSRLKVQYWLAGFAINYVAWPAVVYELFVHERRTWALVTASLWGLFQAVRIVIGVSMRRDRRAATKLVKPLRNLYGILGATTISPRKLKEALDTAAAAGAVFDGAAFAIVDRIVATDATAFIPTQI
jgi:hypothetical protein